MSRTPDVKRTNDIIDLLLKGNTVRFISLHYGTSDKAVTQRIKRHPEQLFYRLKDNHPDLLNKIIYHLDKKKTPSKVATIVSLSPLLVFTIQDYLEAGGER